MAPHRYARGLRRFALARATIVTVLVAATLSLLAAPLPSAAARASREPPAATGAPTSAPGDEWESLFAEAPAPGPPPGTRRPLVGILSQPLPAAAAARLGFPPSSPSRPPSFIAASYVKFVESGGARAVPVRFDAPAEETLRVFSAVNGLLLPGGSADVVSLKSRYRLAGQRLLNLAIEVCVPKPRVRPHRMHTLLTPTRRPLLLSRAGQPGRALLPGPRHVPRARAARGARRRRPPGEPQRRALPLPRRQRRGARAVGARGGAERHVRQSAAPPIPPPLAPP